MKKMLIILFCLGGFAYAQSWQVVKTGAIEESMDEGHFIDVNTGWVFDDTGGKVYKTTDGGAVWTVVREADTLGHPWDDLEFADANVGYSVADDGFIYKTIDGGDNWDMIGDTANYKKDFYCLSVVSEDIVYFGGDDTAAFKTLDGGVTFIDISAGLRGPNLGNDVEKIAFISETMGVALNDGSGAQNWYTHDGGTTWTQAAIPFPVDAYPSTRLYYVDGGGDSTFVIGGYSHTQFLSTDGGKTYVHSGPYTVQGLALTNTAVDVLDNNTMFVAGSDGHITKTTDGGETWDILYTGIGKRDFETINFFDADHGFVLGSENQWFKTADGGATWAPVLAWPNLRLEAIALPEDDKIVVTAGWSGGEMTISADGGLTWSYPDNFATGAVEALYECEFVDADNGMIAGDQGTFAITTNGGATWTHIANAFDGTTSDFKALHYWNLDTVYVGGTSSAIWRSTDGGTTWDEGDYGSTTVYDIWPISATEVVASADAGKIYVADTTGGFGFVEAYDYGSMDMMAVEFRGDVGIVAAKTGLIYRTTLSTYKDTMINIFTDPDGDDLFDVEFVNDSLVFVAGEAGKIYTSSDEAAHEKRPI